MTPTFGRLIFRNLDIELINPDIPLQREVEVWIPYYWMKLSKEHEILEEGLSTVTYIVGIIEE